MENSKGRRSAAGSNADIASTISDFEEVRLEDMDHSGSGEEIGWSGNPLPWHRVGAASQIVFIASLSTALLSQWSFKVIQGHQAVTCCKYLP